MDLSFIRRQRAEPIDLAVLLARTSAAQSASPTARAQIRLDAFTGTVRTTDPHIALFAESLPATAFGTDVASFASLSDRFFSPRQ
jgi:hypothetical protein